MLNKQQLTVNHTITFTNDANTLQILNWQIWHSSNASSIEWVSLWVIMLFHY